MTFIDKLSMLLLAPPRTGARAVVYALALIAVPTIIRWSVDPYVRETGFVPYFPFILLAAMVLETRLALAVALVSAIVGDLLFVGVPFEFMEGATDIFGLIIFLASSVLIIALVEAVRTIVENSLRPARPEGLPTPVVFSLEGGQAWVSWYGSHSWVRLGPEQEVAEMMEDFLVQRQLAERLNRQATGKNP